METSMYAVEIGGRGMEEKYILINDVGTTGTRGVVFDHQTNIVYEAYAEIPQIFPKPGWTEQDPVALFQSCVEVCKKAMEGAKVRPHQVAAMGIATQRASSLIWDAETGEPLYNIITWQDTRMSDVCEKVNHSALYKALHIIGGAYQRIAPLSRGLRMNSVGKLLITAAHFTVTPAQSSAHARWILDNVEGAETKAKAGSLLFGTVDSWLVWNYTKRAVHATDFSNVSATGMYDPFGMKWSPLLLKPFKLPGDLVLPEIRETSGDFGTTGVFGDSIPIKCVAADQQAA
jgi:glycerol kinase